jgi:hypothetical protein
VEVKKRSILRICEHFSFFAETQSGEKAIIQVALITGDTGK